MEIVAKLNKLTPKKKRFTGERLGVSISIYVPKEEPIPKQLIVDLEEEVD